MYNHASRPFAGLLIGEVFVAAITLDRKIEMLPLYRQQEVSDYVDFLLSSVSGVGAGDGAAAGSHPYAGCMSGTFGAMSDDFNEPLGDFKDYM